MPSPISQRLLSWLNSPISIRCALFVAALALMLSPLIEATTATSADPTGGFARAGRQALLEYASTGRNPSGAVSGDIPPDIRQEISPTATSAIVIVNSTTDTADGDTSSIANLIANPGADGVISLREAITAANNTAGADTINFNIAGSGPRTISPLSPLPTVTQAVTIDGTSQPGFLGTPIIELNGSNAGVAANGLNVSAGGVVIKGLVIDHFSGNGILLNGSGNLVFGNTITSNGNNGVVVASGTGNSILSNSISSNGPFFSGGGLGINLVGGVENSFGVTANDTCDADAGANNLQNSPVLTSATSDATSTTITGTLNSLPNTSFRIEFFSNASCDPSQSGEGQTLIGARNVATDASCNVIGGSFTVTGLPPVAIGSVITATATRLDSTLATTDTSEFSQCIPVGVTQGGGGQGADLSVTTTMSPNPVRAGSNVTKTILVVNTGPATATNVTVTDALSGELTFQSCSATAGGVCGGSGNARTVTFASLPPGTTATITIIARTSCLVADSNVIGNTAVVVSSSTPDPNTVNNVSTASAIVTNPAPTIRCPASITQLNDPGSCGAIVNFPPPVVTDNCPIESAVCSPPSGSTFAIGTTTVTCVVTDTSGVQASCSFTVTVNDFERIRIVCPANIVIQAQPGQCSPVVTYPTPTVIDNCPGATVTCTPASGTRFQLGTTPVTCTAVDVAGVRDTCTFTVTVNGSPQATVRLEGGASTLEFGPVSASGKPKKEKKRPARNFTIENIGCIPLVVALDSILRTGSDVDRGRISDPDDRKFFSVKLVSANGTLQDLDILEDVTIQPGQRQNFRVLFNPVIPAATSETRGLSADQVLPDVVTSKLTFIQNGGPPIVINMAGFVETQVRLIDPDNPRRPALVRFSRVEDEFIAEYSIYDSNLDVNTAAYLFFDKQGRPAGQELRADIASLIRQSNFVRGQSFTIIQKFTGAKDHPDIIGIRVTVSDAESSDTAQSSGNAAAGSASAVKSFGAPRGGSLVLPPLEVGLSLERTRQRRRAANNLRQADKLREK